VGGVEVEGRYDHEWYLIVKSGRQRRRDAARKVMDDPTVLGRHSKSVDSPPSKAAGVQPWMESDQILHSGSRFEGVIHLHISTRATES
jgi:hypothetical protein